MNQIQRRGIIILINKTCPEWTCLIIQKEPVDVDCLKLSMQYEGKTVGIFCTYAPTNGLETEFLLKIRRYQLNSNENHTAIIGDMNCTEDRRLDKLGYKRDQHWKCREIIREWLDSGDLQDAFSHINPDTLSYTWKDDMLGKTQGRVDYMLLLPSMMNMVTLCHHLHHGCSQPRISLLSQELMP
jgi:exonuclease III